jgi:tryptophan synthase alpha chain
MNRIQKIFSEKKNRILSVFYTAGYPNLKSTNDIALHLQEAGADIIEIGIPFSDPIADGPVIQESNKIALDNGMTLKILLKQVKELREKVKLPIILMGYINPILQYGMEEFCRDATAAGVDGVILPDLPMDEYQTEYKSMFEKYRLSNTFLMSPTTSEKRIRQIDEATDGFIYAVSASSTTGARKGFDPEQENYFKRLQSLHLKNPFLIGFGISDEQTFSKASEYSAGAIVGSAFITMLKDSKDLKTDIHQFVKRLTNAPSQF